MSATSSAIEGPGLTWEQFLDLPDQQEYGPYPAALIDGEIIWMSPPTSGYERIGGNIVSAFLDWEKGGPGRGAGHTSPAVRITDRRGYVADYGWWNEARLDRRDRLVFPANPDLAVEVWSPSNWPSEQLRKTNDYARAGVAELWGIDPKNEVVLVARTPVAGAYTDLVDRTGDDILSSPLLAGFELPLAEVFRP